MPEELKQEQMRAKKTKKVCVVEDDIKLTDEEKEVLKEMLAEKQAEEEKNKSSPKKK